MPQFYETLGEEMQGHLRQAYRLSVGQSPEQLRDETYVRLMALMLHHEAMMMRNMGTQAIQISDDGRRLGDNDRLALMLGTRRVIEDLQLIKRAMVDLLEVNFEYTAPPVEVMEKVYELFTTAEINDDDA